VKLIHTDLYFGNLWVFNWITSFRKPENILLVDDSFRVEEQKGEEVKILNRTDIRLIDFGGATLEDDHHSKIVNTRQYRGPEVIMGICDPICIFWADGFIGLGWSYESDMWSVGCIIAELYTGKLLFSTHDDLEHLALMEKILGRPLPKDMCAEALRIQDKSRSRRSSRSHSRGRSSRYSAPFAFCF
jgi:dual-specificity kinase